MEKDRVEVYECCECCNKSEKCTKSQAKIISCQKEFEEYCEEQKKAEEEYTKYVLEHPELYFCDDDARFILEEYSNDDDECREIFNKYRCKGCERYDSCFYAECAADTYWEAQQHSVTSGTYAAAETVEAAETTLNDDIPF